ncbi:hypothetical protein ACNVED_16005 (plasmid) [Legionella sp. D16C41]|uniref:hypothetical protein n=1 Tax=Legionella sp. D16C41 TaxID=3402688 RepID=UPI003AF55DBF
MSKTLYEQHLKNLDSEQVTREIISEKENGIARGVSAPYDGAPTPCVTQIFSFIKEPNLDYVFTDSLTGCAGIIAVSGDGSPFKPANALVIHDKGGDHLKSSKKLLEDFFIDQQKQGYTKMRLIWGNGVINGAIVPTHTEDTKKMIHSLGHKYSHLDIKHLPNQTTLVIDKNGNPIKLAQNPAVKTADMNMIYSNYSAVDIQQWVNTDFDRPFQANFIPPTHKIKEPKEHIDDALLEGKFPNIAFLQSQDMTYYLNCKTATIPTNASSLESKILLHLDPLLKTIGEQLQYYNKKYVDYNKWGPSREPEKARLMSRKWWALLFMANELMEGLNNKPIRNQLFKEDFYSAWVPESMNGRFSTAAKLINKADREFILSKKFELLSNSSHQQLPYSSEIKLRISITKVPPNQRDNNIQAVLHVLDNEKLICNEEEAVPVIIKKIKTILDNIDYNDEKNIAQALIEVKELINQEPSNNYSPNTQDIITAFKDSNTFQQVRNNLSKNLSIDSLIQSFEKKNNLNIN